MGQRTSHKPGTFSWTDLATNDAAGAKSFYSSLFGWEYQDAPIPEGGVYSMALRDGSEVAALSETQDQPPHWNCYVTVESADDATAHARDVGAGVMVDPFDVMDVGRMSVITDPAGAALCLWEPRTNIGASLVNAPGRDDVERPPHARSGGLLRVLRARCSAGGRRRWRTRAATA